MEGASGAVEFLSVECDMIFEPDCDLDSECHADTQQEGGRGRAEGALLTLHTSTTAAPPPSHTPLLVHELFKGRNVGVYKRSDPKDHFVLIYDPTLHSPVGDIGGKGEGSGCGGTKEDGEGRKVPARCKVCRKQFQNHGCLVTHSLTHLQPSPGTPLPCPVCGAALPSRVALKIHVRRHFSMRTHQCPGCHQRHLSRAQLALHQQLHGTHRHNPQSTPSLPNNPKDHQAQEKTQSPKEHQIKAHSSTKERQNRPLSSDEHHVLPQSPQEVSQAPGTDLHCNRCDLTFPTRAALSTHRKSHRERRRRRRRRHECPECGSQFWRSSGLKKHRRNEHDI